MRIRLLPFVICSSLFVILKGVAVGQGISAQQLEEKVYQLNNQLKYNESQALLLPLLQDESLSPDYKYRAAILLSYTYKRVFDYQSTLKFLEIALNFAGQTPKKEMYVADIQSEQAFVYFDTHHYSKADSLMRVLAKADFEFISLENKSKLVMQQGYLFFLDKKYQKADDNYNLAIQSMQASNPCNLPMIYVKKMQLYNAMNRLDLLKQALAKSTFYADSCGILKYHLYAHEELLTIYEGRNELTLIAATKKKLDSLNLIYAREEHISSLHNQQETILLKDKDQEIEREQTSLNWLAFTLAVIVVLALALLGWIVFYRRKQRRMEADFQEMKGTLQEYLDEEQTLTAQAKPYEKQAPEE